MLMHFIFVVLYIINKPDLTVCFTMEIALEANNKHQLSFHLKISLNFVLITCSLTCHIYSPLIHSKYFMNCPFIPASIHCVPLAFKNFLFIYLPSYELNTDIIWHWLVPWWEGFSGFAQSSIFHLFHCFALRQAHSCGWIHPKWLCFCTINCTLLGNDLLQRSLKSVAFIVATSLKCHVRLCTFGHLTCNKEANNLPFNYCLFYSLTGS